MNASLSEAIQNTGLIDANELQLSAFSGLKSGRDCMIVSDSKSGKTTLLVMYVIQMLEKAKDQSPRALIMVESKEDLEKMIALFQSFGRNTNLRVFGIHDKGDDDYDKNFISGGIDVLIGTPPKLAHLFASAGFDVNQLKMFVVDDFDVIVKLHLGDKVSRFNSAISKSQQVFFASSFLPRTGTLCDKLLENPLYI